MRLIDADALKETIAKYEFKTPDSRRKWGGDVVLNIYMPKIIDDAPAIEFEPVRHGRWEKCDLKKLEHGFVESIPGGGICCSECRCGFSKQYMWWTYCPSCGAKMDRGNENES